MSGFEWNKIAGAVLLAGLIAMVVGTVADSLYQPKLSPKKRGYQVAVESTDKGGAEGAAKEEAVDVAALLAAAKPDDGKKVLKKCETCHSVDKDGPNKIGPTLWDIVGREKGKHEGFSYSDGMKSKGGNWDYDALFAFLKLPKNYVQGTKMTFAGMSKPQDIANLVSYLRTLSDSPVALPKPTANAAPSPTPTTAEDAAKGTIEGVAPKK